MKALIDTNIWLDYALKREPFSSDAGAALMVCINEDVEMLIAATSAKDIFYIAEKMVDANQAYSFMEKIFEIADVAPVDSVVCSNALMLERPDYEDGIIAAVAQVEKADLIISRDQDAFNDIEIPKYSPKEFIEFMGYVEVGF